MDKIISACYFLAVLSVLVLAHEWGHFIVAKLCGMRVDDFSLFFGKRLIRLGERNGTEYNIRSVPLGGFVKIAGMEPEDVSNGAPLLRRDPKERRFAKILQGLDYEALEQIDPEQISERVEHAVEDAVEDGKLTTEGEAELFALANGATITAQEQRYIELALATKNYVPDPALYNQKPLWQRAAVIFAGPVMSLFLGYFLFCAMGMTAGLPHSDYTENVIESVVRGKPADKVGLKPGDRIVQINDAKVTNGEQMVGIIHNNPGVPLRLVVERDKAPLLTLTATPDVVDVSEDSGSGKPAVETGTVGICAASSSRVAALWRGGRGENGNHDDRQLHQQYADCADAPETGGGQCRRRPANRRANPSRQQGRPLARGLYRRPAEYQPGDYEPAAHTCLRWRASAAAQYRRHPPAQADRARSVRRAISRRFHHRRPLRAGHVQRHHGTAAQIAFADVPHRAPTYGHAPLLAARSSPGEGLFRFLDVNVSLQRAGQCIVAIT